MKKLIVDTNIILSYLYSQNSKILNVIDNDDFEIYAPNYIIYEFIKHQKRIMTKTKLNDAEYTELIGFILMRFYFVNIRDISFPNISYALRLCSDIDENDTIFVALALQMNCPIWTRDEILKNGLKSRGFDNFFLEEK